MDRDVCYVFVREHLAVVAASRKTPSVVTEVNSVHHRSSGRMTEAEGHVQEDGTARSSFPPPLSHRKRFPVQKNNVCSRSYFVVVMVFFHVYILNVIALLLYVHYNTGSDAGVSSRPVRIKVPETVEHPSSYPHLPRIEGIRVRICFTSPLNSVNVAWSKSPALQWFLWGLTSHCDGVL